jgi:hypothetical protein
MRMAVEVNQTALSSAPHVIAVNPDLVMVMPRPMPGCPNVVNRADIVPRAVDVIWLVTNFDVHDHGVGSRNHRCEHRQNYPNF